MDRTEFTTNKKSHLLNKSLANSQIYSLGGLNRVKGKVPKHHIQIMGHVVQHLLRYHHLVNPEEGGVHCHDNGGQLLLDELDHQVGDVTEQLFETKAATVLTTFPAMCLLTVSRNSLNCPCFNCPFRAV
jgi:hypothetical protein